jgi:putative ABC transport system permease protein
MRISDYIEQSFCNLWKKKLRTFLTTSGVVIGIGALVCMIAFGQGIQKNITKNFNDMGLFSYMGVYPANVIMEPEQFMPEPDIEKKPEKPIHILNDSVIRELTEIEGVESVFPELRFPAVVGFNDKEQFTLIQVLPAEICQSELMKLRAGKPYESDDANSLIISDVLLHRLNISKPESVIGKEIEVSTLAFDLSFSGLSNIISFLNGKGTPFSRKNYKFKIGGVSQRMGFTGPMPMECNIFIGPGVAQGMKKLALTSISDFFNSSQQAAGYPSVNIKLASPKYIDSVRKQIEDYGFRTFTLADQLEQIKTGFIIMDMFLFAIGMIAITVSALGIINTMVMSILERYKEIGIMKAVGAGNSDVKKIYFFESGMIGFMGGLGGLALGWMVSVIINLIINGIAGRQGVPNMSYFSFPLWLCLGAVIFSILISLIAGIYPTMRAARVDPVVALRHD